MKAVVSIPDAIFTEAERFARRRGMSRSELYAKAVKKYMASERFLGVRERLDAIYGKSSEDSRLDPTLEKIQFRS